MERNNVVPNNIYGASNNVSSDGSEDSLVKTDREGQTIGGERQTDRRNAEAASRRLDADCQASRRLARQLMARKAAEILAKL